MTNPIPSATLAADRDALLALRELPGYTAVNPDFSIQQLIELEGIVTNAAQATVRARQALVAARDAEIAAKHAFHNGMLGAKAAVTAQYGNDSSAVQAIGLKKKSEHKRPARRAPRTTGTST